MCQFFSLVSDGKGKIMFFDWKIRKQILKRELDYQPDSHTSIADYYGYKGEKEDKLNKYEYNFLTGKFTIDQLNTVNDSTNVKAFCEKLNPQKIIPSLVKKPIINPFNDKSCEKITNADLRLLKKWDSVRNSVRDSVWASVWASVGDSVWASVRNSVRDSVWASVWASVGASVWDSVGAYISSFFKIKYKHDFSCCVKLWEKGIVASYDNRVWRLHGKDGKVLATITPEKLKRVK